MHKYLLVSAFFLGSLWPMCAQNGQPEADPNFQQQLQSGHDALAAGNYKEALDTFKKLNKLHNNSCALCYIDMAVVYERTAQFDNAIANCDRALGVAETNQIKATAHSLKGTAILSRGGGDDKNLKDAEAEYRAALQLDDNDPVFHFNLATALLRQSKDDEAKDELRKCLALHPVQALTGRATRLVAIQGLRGKI